MAITSLSDILWYWDAIAGVQPIVGGDPTFSRASSGLVMPDRAHRVRSLAADYPRFPWVTVGGERLPAMLLEKASTNKLTDSNDFSASGNWFISPGLTMSAVESVFGGQSAYRADNDGVLGARSINQTIGTLTGSDESMSVVWEDIDADEMRFGIRDVTAASWVILARYIPSTESLSVTFGAGTLHGPIDLGGGRVWLGATGSGTASNTRAPHIYPTGTTKAVRSAIVHFAQHEEAAVPTSPIITTTAAAARAAESMQWAGAPRPQAMVIYSDLVMVAVPLAGDGNRIWHIGESDDSAPRLLLRHNGANVINVFLENGTNSANTSITLSPAPAVNDRIQVVAVVNADGSGRLISSLNGAAVQAAALSAPTGGLPTSWSDNVLWLNSVGASSVNAHKYRQLKIVKPTNLDAALDGTEDQALMDEMAALTVNQYGSVRV